MSVVTGRQRADEANRLRRMGEIADRVAGDQWAIDSDDRGTFVVADRFDGKRLTLLKFGQKANDDEIWLISRAVETLLFCLPLLDRAKKRIRQLEKQVRDLTADIEAMKTRKDHAANASMLLSDAVFQRFLSEMRDGEVVDDKDTADAALKALIGIQSKKEINADDGARARWLDLRARFSAWQTGAMG